MQLHNIKDNEAYICFWNDVYHVYRGDGYYAIEVWTSRTLFGAEKFCNENGWKIRR